MKHIDDWHEALCKELDKLYEENNGEINPQILDAADKALHALKSLKAYEAMDESGYSEGGSYARGRYSRREGRYSRDDGSYRGPSYRGYSRDDEYDMYPRPMYRY